MKRNETREIERSIIYEEWKREERRWEKKKNRIYIYIYVCTFDGLDSSARRLSIVIIEVRKERTRKVIKVSGVATMYNPEIHRLFRCISYNEIHWI